VKYQIAIIIDLFDIVFINNIPLSEKITVNG